MELLTAQLVFFAIMTLGVCIWCHSLIRATQLKSVGDKTTDAWTDTISGEQHPNVDCEIGSKLVRGDQETVSRAIAKSILQHGTAFEVTERTAIKVVAKTTPAAQNTPAGANFSEVGFALRPAGEDTVEIVYCADFGKKRDRMRMIALGIIWGIGLPVILIVGIFTWIYGVNAGNPGMRWMTLQAMHIGHALWIPFLFIHQHKNLVAHSKAFLANLLTSVSLADGVDAVH
jgi:hypothetical protein